MIRFLTSWSPALLWAGGIIFLSAQSSVPGADLFPFSDKVAHFILFGVLGAALAWGGRTLRSPRSHALVVALGLLFAASDEWHQSFVPGRDPSAGDFLADVLGVLAGYILTRALLARKSRESQEVE